LSDTEMRRTIALALVLIFGWTLTAPLLASDAEANLPACCRRGGKHHCMMPGMGQQSGKQSGVASIAAKCPCCPAIACTAYSPIFKPEAAHAFDAYAASHHSCAPQSEDHFGNLSLRGHQKRGPPAPFA